MDSAPQLCVGGFVNHTGKCIRKREEEAQTFFNSPSVLKVGGTHGACLRRSRTAHFEQAITLTSRKTPQMRERAAMVAPSWQQTVAGWCSGSAVISLVYPLDTVRARIQTGRPRPFTSPWQCLRYVCCSLVLCPFCSEHSTCHPQLTLIPTPMQIDHCPRGRGGVVPGHGGKRPLIRARTRAQTTPQYTARASNAKHTTNPCRLTLTYPLHTHRPPSCWPRSSSVSTLRCTVPREGGGLVRRVCVCVYGGRARSRLPTSAPSFF